MAHLMFQSCCYSWFVKGTWRVSYCAGKAREKLSCKCSATNISPFQGCLPSAASHFQDSVLKGKVPGQYCSTLVFSKAFHWVRYQIKTEDAHIQVEHLEVLPKSQGGKHFSDSSPKKKKKSKVCPKGHEKFIMKPEHIPAEHWSCQTSLIWLFQAFSRSCFVLFFYFYAQRGAEKSVSVFQMRLEQEQKSVPSALKSFFYLPLFFLLPACANDNTLRDLHLCAGAGEVLQA